ncbi:MAG: A/G-specific adenine glycosylase [Chloroflexi bacterium]|nr:A/G-specific adenine glycosylase [Chloroflexota bacterium]MDL1884268.1 A/G-specific adenine glycosylase [Anaerolineae bacterium CFX8]
MNPEFQTALLAWYDRHAADLPWRSTYDVYRIWLSEVMLQQTQVETVKPYYARFLAAYPTIDDLAAAPLADVLKLWEGLGYYSRARNLHQTAQRVSRELGGLFPRSADELQKLPGIGRYTAGAIASIAYGQRAPALDGNVIRVLARLTDLEADVSLPAVKQDLWALAEAGLPADRPGDYNQALMELGRVICKPRAPLCGQCPVRAHCRAHAAGTQQQRPVKTRKPPMPHYDVAAGMIWNERGQLLIAQRPLDGLLGGLWEFPGGKQEPGETLPDCLKRELREELAIEVEVGDLFVVVRHAFTHFRITLHAFTCRWRGGPPRAIGVRDWAWVAPGELHDYSFGKADREVIKALEARGGMLF